MTLELITQKRNLFGKKVNHLRKNGLIPAELYGHNIENLHLALFEKEFLKVFEKAGENEIINLIIDDQKIPVLIHDIQIDPLTNKIIHIDLYQIKMTEKITVNVPLEFINEAPAVKEKDGILVKAMQEIKIETLPANIPHSIKVDLASLDDIGKSIYVSDLVLPPKIKILVDAKTVIATITKKTEEEVAPQEIKVEEIVTEAEEKRAKKLKDETPSTDKTKSPEPKNK